MKYKAPVTSLGLNKKERAECDKDAQNLLKRMKQRHLEHKLNGKRPRATDTDKRDSKKLY